MRYIDLSPGYTEEAVQKLNQVFGREPSLISPPIPQIKNDGVAEKEEIYKLKKYSVLQFRARSSAG